MIRYLILISLIIPASAHAILDLIVKEKITVYAKPTSESKKISKLSKGDVVVISPKSYGSFRKVLITYDGKRQGGYIPSKEIVLSITQERVPDDENLITYKKSFGGALGVNFAYVQAGALQITGYPQARAENLLGFDFLALAHYNMAIGHSTVLEFSAAKRALSISGDVEYITNSGHQKTEVKEKGFSLGVFAKFYSKRSSIFYNGLGIEVFKVTDVEITVNGGQPVPYGGDKEVLFAPTLGFGWDLQLTERMFLSPDFRLGGFVTRDPIAIFADLRIAAHFLL